MNSDYNIVEIKTLYYKTRLCPANPLRNDTTIKLLKGFMVKYKWPFIDRYD